MKMESIASIIDFDPFVVRTQTDATHNLGDQLRLADGRAFRYGKAGAAATSDGKLEVAPTPKANHHNLVATAAAIGSFQVTVTLGATAAVANEYAEGYLVVNAGPGVGQTYKIKGHPAASSAATLVLDLFDPITSTALTTASRATLVHNSYNGVIESTSVTQRPAGVSLVDLAAGNYGWFQHAGVASVLAAATVAVGSWCVASTATAGAVTGASVTIATTVTEARVGYAIVAGVSTESRPVFLTIE